MREVDIAKRTRKGARKETRKLTRERIRKWTCEGNLKRTQKSFKRLLEDQSELIAHRQR